MAGESFPYPRSPKKIPVDLTEFSAEFRKKQTTLVVCLVAFLVLYVGLMIASGVGVILSLLLLPKMGLLSLISAFGCGVLFLFLIKGVFHSFDADDELHIRVRESDHPPLFGFIRKLCEEVGVEEPNAVYVSSDVNAAAITRTTILNLFVPPKRDLLIGLGLVNSLNLSEFKAVLGHEFGHFSQGGFINSYFFVVYRIAYGIASGNSWLDRMIEDMRRSDSALMVVGTALWLPMVAFRWCVQQIFQLLGFLRHSVLRDAEFHADLVGSSVAGSNAMTHSLYRSELGSESYNRALFELAKAADHKLYSADIFYHQSAVVELIRKDKEGRKEEYKERIELEKAKDGKKLRVFDTKTSFDPASVGDYHPSNSDREDNIKERFLEAEEDKRPAWLLFEEPSELREVMTYKMYRRAKLIRKESRMKDPAVVQEFIDNEHKETTYDERYGGCYDDRLINPGDLELLDIEIRDTPWDGTKIATVHAKLFHDIETEVVHRRKLLKKLEKARERAPDMPRKKARKIIRELEADLEEATNWFHSVDRKVYLVSVQMGQRLDDERLPELKSRYRFHMAVQRIYRTACEHYDQCNFMLLVLNDLQSRRASPAEIEECQIETIEILKNARRALKGILLDASEISIPTMVKFTKGEQLSKFLLRQQLIKEAYEFGVTGKWIDKLFGQLSQVRARSHRLHFKSMGGILALQEEIARDFAAITKAE